MADWRWTRRRKRRPCHSQSPCSTSKDTDHLFRPPPKLACNQFNHFLFQMSTSSSLSSSSLPSSSSITTSRSTFATLSRRRSIEMISPPSPSHDLSSQCLLSSAAFKHIRPADPVRSCFNACSARAGHFSLMLDSMRSVVQKCSSFLTTIDGHTTRCLSLPSSSFDLSISIASAFNRARSCSKRCSCFRSFFHRSILCLLLMSCILGPVQALGAFWSGAPANSSSSASDVTPSSSSTSSSRTSSIFHLSSSNDSFSPRSSFVSNAESHSMHVAPAYSNRASFSSHSNSSQRHSLRVPSFSSSSTLPLLQALQTSTIDLSVAGSAGSSRRTVNNLRPQSSFAPSSSSSLSSSFPNYDSKLGYNYKSFQPKVNYSPSSKHRKETTNRSHYSSTSSSMYIDTYDFTSAPAPSMLSTSLPETLYQQTLKRQNAAQNQSQPFSSIEPRVTYSRASPFRKHKKPLQPISTNQSATVQPPYAFTGSAAPLRANRTFDKDSISLSNQGLFKPIFTITRSNGKIKNYYKNEEEESDLMQPIASSTTPVSVRLPPVTSRTSMFDDDLDPVNQPVDEAGRKIDLRLLWRKEFDEQAVHKMPLNSSPFPASDVSLFALLPVRDPEDSDHSLSTESTTISSTALPMLSDSVAMNITPRQPHHHIQFTASDQIHNPPINRVHSQSVGSLSSLNTERPSLTSGSNSLIELYSRPRLTPNTISTTIPSQDSINFAKPTEMLANLQYASTNRTRMGASHTTVYHSLVNDTAFIPTQAKQLPAAGLKQALDRAAANSHADSIGAASGDSPQSVTATPEPGLFETKVTTGPQMPTLSPFRPIDHISNANLHHSHHNHFDMTNKPTGIVRPISKLINNITSNTTAASHIKSSATLASNKFTSNSTNADKLSGDTIDASLRPLAKLRHPSLRNNSTINRESAESADRTKMSEAGEPYRLSTERLAYLLIGGCCALSLICLLVVALSLRCRDMCDEYREWKSAEKLALFNYRYAQHQQQRHRQQRLKLHELAAFGGGRLRSESSGGSGSQLLGSNGGGTTPPTTNPQSGLLSDPSSGRNRHHATATESAAVAASGNRANKSQNSPVCPINLSRPIFGPSCCCCPNAAMFLAKEGAAASTAAVTKSADMSVSNACPRGYFHPCPRGRLPFGAASSLFARFNGTSNGRPVDAQRMANETIMADEDSLIVSMNEQTTAAHNESNGHESGANCLQCTCDDSFDEQSDDTSPNDHHSDKNPISVTNIRNNNNPAISHAGKVANSHMHSHVGLQTTAAHATIPVTVSAAAANSAAAHRMHHMHHHHYHAHDRPGHAVMTTADAHHHHMRSPQIVPGSKVMLQSSNQWIHNSMLVDELHRKQMQKNVIAKQAANRSKNGHSMLNANAERAAVFWSGNTDRLI